MVGTKVPMANASPRKIETVQHLRAGAARTARGAKELRVSIRSVQRWLRAWDRSGPWALRSEGAAPPLWLSEAQFVQLEAELANGSVAHGRPDQRWTLSRIKTVIGRRFHMSYILQGVRKLLLRRGFSGCSMTPPTAGTCPARPYPRHPGSRPLPAPHLPCCPTCYKPGERSRLVYRPRRGDG